MINYITPEQFLEQPKEIQKVFMDWLEPRIGDLYCDINAYGVDDISCIIYLWRLKCINTDKKHNYFIPLLQMHQLIQFIEDKLDSKIIINFSVDNYTIGIMSDEKAPIYFYKLGNNLLQAIWKVAIEVAEER